MKNIFGLFVVVSASFVLGCGGAGGGPALLEVGGTVNLDGKAVGGANVTFVYDDGQVASGVTGDDGKFTLTTGGRGGAPEGSAKVTVAKSTTDGMDIPTEYEDPTEMMQKMMENKSKEDLKKGAEEMLPAKYSDATTSGLTADVKSGEDNTAFVFNLVK